jgi:hypothetical protein
MAHNPAAKFRIGRVTATVWKNEGFYNTTLERTYKEGEDYKQVNSFGHADLLNAARVLQRAEAWISDQE